MVSSISAPRKERQPPPRGDFGGLRGCGGHSEYCKLLVPKLTETIVNHHYLPSLAKDLLPSPFSSLKSRVCLHCGITTVVENNSKMSHSSIAIRFLCTIFCHFVGKIRELKHKKYNEWETFGNFQTCVRNVSVRPLKLQQRRKLRSFFVPF